MPLPPLLTPSARIRRYNEYQTDPYSHGSPFAAICSRGDLADPPAADGCYDTKVHRSPHVLALSCSNTRPHCLPGALEQVTNYAMARQMQSEAVNGPTAQTLPPFKWTPDLGAAHEGQPVVFNFDFELMQPTLAA